MENLERSCKLSETTRKIFDENLDELWTNVVEFKRKCTTRDQVLCDSLLSMSITTTFDVSIVSVYTV